MYTVTSEIYKETNFRTEKTKDGKVISKFKFTYPPNGEEASKKSQTGVITDKDGDLVVQRKSTTSQTCSPGTIEIEHSEATEIRLVGLQVWRGALLLADFFFSFREEFKDKQILELGAGVGLTSIAASIFAQQLICTDVDIGGILNLIRANVERNRSLHIGNIQVLEYDFMQKAEEYAPALREAIDKSDIVVAADVIYDDELTNAFINVIDVIFERESLSGKRKTIYVALEKRYVFTISDVDAVAPMYEHFLKQTLSKPWHFEYIPIDFPQYFEYERCKELVLLKLTSR